MDKCPICEYPLDQCQCLYSGDTHPDRSKRQRVVLDHLYILSEPQLRHVIELQRWWNVSYADPELTEICDKMNAVNKKNASIRNEDEIKSNETLKISAKDIAAITEEKTFTAIADGKYNIVIKSED